METSLNSNKVTNITYASNRFSLREINHALTLLLLILSSSCSHKSTIETKFEFKKITNSDYIIQDYSRRCTSASIDSNLVLTPTRCELIVDNSEEYDFYDQIRGTSNKKWLTLIKSDTAEISRSASIWLYHLNHEKIDLIELALLQDSLNYFKKNQVNFWSSYLDKKSPR